MKSTFCPLRLLALGLTVAMFAACTPEAMRAAHDIARASTYHHYGPGGPGGPGPGPYEPPHPHPYYDPAPVFIP